MDTSAIPIFAAIIGAAVALTGLVVTVLVMSFRGSFRLGQLFQRMDDQDENIRQMREEMRQSNAELREAIQLLTTEMRDNHRQLSNEIRQTNEAVIALANHRHDQDGNIIFILPVQPGG